MAVPCSALRIATADAVLPRPRPRRPPPAPSAADQQNPELLAAQKAAQQVRLETGDGSGGGSTRVEYLEALGAFRWVMHTFFMEFPPKLE